MSITIHVQLMGYMVHAPLYMPEEACGRDCISAGSAARAVPMHLVKRKGS